MIKVLTVSVACTLVACTPIFAKGGGGSHHQMQNIQKPVEPPKITPSVKTKTTSPDGVVHTRPGRQKSGKL